LSYYYIPKDSKFLTEFCGFCIRLNIWGVFKMELKMLGYDDEDDDDFDDED